MDIERFERIKENVNIRCTIANISGIGITTPYKEELELIDEIERLNNVINGMEKFFQYAYDNEVKSLNDRKVSVWTICLDKLQELKGSGSNE